MSEPAEQLPMPAVPLTPEQQARRDNMLWGGLLLLLTLIIYQPAIRGAFLWDDDRHVSQNRALRSVGGLVDIWFHPSTGKTLETGYVTPQYYPLSHTTYWIEYHLWGVGTTGYHLVNILLHAGAALVLWQLLKRLKVPGAWLAAAIFAVHPIEVESVAWITERKNVLSGLLFLSSIYAYLRFVEPEEESDGVAWRWYGLAFLLFAGAVFAKTVTSLMPVVVVILLYWRFRRRMTVRTLLPLLPMLLLGMVLGRQTAWMEKHVVGAIGADWDLTLAQRVVVAGHAFWFYLGKLLWPLNLLFTYPRWDVKTGGSGDWIYVGAAAAVIAGSAVWLLVGKRWRGVPVAILIYAAMLVPASGFFDVFPMRFSFVADHFQYHAGIAIIALIAAGVTSCLWRGEGAAGAQVLQGIAGVVILVLAVLTWRQSAIYADPITLWTDTVTRNPNAWMAHYNLGTEFAKRGLKERADGDADAATKTLAEASKQFDECVALRPGHANAYANWGYVLMELGQYPLATEKLRRSIEIDPAQDEPHYTLGQVYERTNKPAEAEAAYRTAVSLDATAWRSHLAIGRLLATRNDLAGAEVALRRAEQVHPNDIDVQYSLGGVTLDLEGKSKEALPHVIRASEIQPENAKVLTTLGYVFGKNGRPNESFDAFRRALVIDPNDKAALEGAKLLIDAVAAQRRAATRPSTTRSTTMRSVVRVPATGAVR